MLKIDKNARTRPTKVEDGNDRRLVPSSFSTQSKKKTWTSTESNEGGELR